MKKYFPLMTAFLLCFGLTLSLISSAGEAPCNEKCQKLKADKLELKKKYSEELAKQSEGLKLKPYIGVKVVQNAKQLSECPQKTRDEKQLDSKMYDFEKNCQCYYVQIDGVDYSDLSKAMAIGEFARTKCLEEARIKK